MFGKHIFWFKFTDTISDICLIYGIKLFKNTEYLIWHYFIVRLKIQEYILWKLSSSHHYMSFIHIFNLQHMKSTYGTCFISWDLMVSLWRSLEFLLIKSFMVGQQQEKNKYAVLQKYNHRNINEKSSSCYVCWRSVQSY